MYELLKKFQGKHSVEEVSLICESFDTVYNLIHKNPNLFEEKSLEEIVNFCVSDMKIVEEKIISDKITPGLSSAVKLGNDITVYMCRGNISSKLNKYKLSNYITKTTRFDLASISKLFTALEFLKQEQDKKIDLNMYLDEYNSKFNLHVPIQKILTFNYNIQTKGRIDKVAKNEKDVIKMLEEATIKEENTHLYTDIGYMILAQANKTFKEDFHNYFVNDMNLTNTGYEIRENDVVTGGPYNRIREVHDPKARLIPYAGHAGVFSTSEDLVKLYDALKDGFLTEEQYNKIVTPTLDKEYMTKDTMYLADRNGEARLDQRGNKIPIKRGMEYRHHELGFACSEVAPSQTDNAFSCAGFTGGWITIDYLNYKDPETWMNAILLTNPLSAKEEIDGIPSTKEKGYTTMLNEAKYAQLKALYELYAFRELYENIYQEKMKVKNKIFHI